MGSKYVTEEVLDRRFAESDEKMHKRFDELTSVISDAFTAMTGEVHEIKGDLAEMKTDLAEVRTDLAGVKADLVRVKHTVNATDNKLARHLEMSDDQYHEFKDKNKKHEKWLGQLARATKVQLIPALLE